MSLDGETLLAELNEEPAKEEWDREDIMEVFSVPQQTGPSVLAGAGDPEASTQDGDLEPPSPAPCTAP